MNWKENIQRRYGQREEPTTKTKTEVFWTYFHLPLNCIFGDLAKNGSVWQENITHVLRILKTIALPDCLLLTNSVRVTLFS